MFDVFMQFKRARSLWIWVLTHCHLENYHADAPNITGESVIFTIHSLWGPEKDKLFIEERLHVGHGSDESVTHVQRRHKIFADSEVSKLCITILRTNKDIIGFDITMN